MCPITNGDIIVNGTPIDSHFLANMAVAANDRAQHLQQQVQPGMLGLTYSIRDLPRDSAAYTDVAQHRSC